MQDNASMSTTSMCRGMWLYLVDNIYEMTMGPRNPDEPGVGLVTKARRYTCLR